MESAFQKEMVEDRPLPRVGVLEFIKDRHFVLGPDCIGQRTQRIFSP